MIEFDKWLEKGDKGERGIKNNFVFWDWVIGKMIEREKLGVELIVGSDFVGFRLWSWVVVG